MIAPSTETPRLTDIFQTAVVQIVANKMVTHTAVILGVGAPRKPHKCTAAEKSLSKQRI